MLEEHADQAASSEGKMEDRRSPAAAQISTNVSKPDEMMLYNDTFDNEAKERDGFAARQPRSLSSKPDEECIVKQWIKTHTSTREDSTSKVVYCQFFFRNPCNTKYKTQAKKRNILTPGAPKWVKDTGNELK